MCVKNCLQSYIKCGKVYEPTLPNNLEQSEAPIVLAEVSADTIGIQSSCIFVKFSEFINFTLLGLNPKLNIIYRLVRQDIYFEIEEILQQWEFEFESSNILEIANLDTNQPTVLNYCDCLDKYSSNKIIYRLEIIQIKSNNVENYGITNKSITAKVTNGLCKCNRDYLPYIECGKVFNPVLPLNLSKEDEPVTLTQVTINTECNDICVLINFSSFITSVLREADFSNLTFRLVRDCNDGTKKVIKEWPFRRVFVSDTNIKEPLVYNYCECLNSKYDLEYTYSIQLVEVNLSKESFYDITQKSITAQVYPRDCHQGIW